MYLDYISLFWVLLAVLAAGIMLGRAWSYISLKEEKDFSNRIVRGSSSYLLGMNYLISNQQDLAIMELSRAAKQDPDALEVKIVLGNLFREKGQAERAIQIHRNVLEQKSISPSEKNLAMFCLALDYKSAGFVDRSIELFEQILEMDRTDERVFGLLVKLYEEVGQFDKAYRLQQELIRLQRKDDFSLLAFLEVQMGKKLMDRGESEAAERRFRKAIDLEPKTYPAYLYYGDLLLERKDVPQAIEKWEQMVRSNYKRAHLVFDRLYKAYKEQGKPERMESILREVLDKHNYEWRGKLFLARILLEKGDLKGGYELMKEAARMNPHSLAIHQQIWKLFSIGTLDISDIEDYLKLTEDIIFFLDPFVCLECGYRTTEFLWKCPHCHTWESFVEVRL